MLIPLLSMAKLTSIILLRGALNVKIANLEYWIRFTEIATYFLKSALLVLGLVQVIGQEKTCD